MMRQPSKQTRFTLTAIAAGIALALPVSAGAERGEPVYYEPADFETMDIDDNDLLDSEEVQGRSPLAGQWERFDTNGDGLIEREEFADFKVYEGETPDNLPPIPPSAEPGPDAPALGPEVDAPGFAELDINDDGVLSKGEAGGRKGLLDEFWQVDGNRNNVIERDELAAYEAYPGSTLPPEAGSMP